MIALVAAAAVVWTGCEHKPRVRPASAIVACADANFSIDHITWTSWGAKAAVGHGTAHANDCTPNCAAGHFHAFPVTVRLSKVVRCVDGRREFARIEWRGKQTGNETLPCVFLRLKP
ncbi:MAG: hypothetical protein ABUS54_06525 [Actinomycetota bacterium]